MPRARRDEQGIKYISPDQVADLILAEPKRDDFVIIGAHSPLLHETVSREVTELDVRSTDFAGGNLPGAVNITTSEFRDERSLPSLKAEQTPSNSSRLIHTHILPRPSLTLLILHCMRSQTRGPFAAHLLSQSPLLPPQIEVRVMEGGFAGWWRRFRDDERRERLFEGLLERQEGSAREGGEWVDVVQANEGEDGEAEDSRELRRELGR
ncbi:hypothetical protein JCM10295v2_003017 [Rhodotorula toruloides]